MCMHVECSVDLSRTIFVETMSCPGLCSGCALRHALSDEVLALCCWASHANSGFVCLLLGKALGALQMNGVKKQIARAAGDPRPWAVPGSEAGEGNSCTAARARALGLRQKFFLQVHELSRLLQQLESRAFFLICRLRLKTVWAP